MEKLGWTEKWEEAMFCDKCNKRNKEALVFNSVNNSSKTFAFEHYSTVYRKSTIVGGSIPITEILPISKIRNCKIKTTFGYCPRDNMSECNEVRERKCRKKK